MTDPGALLGAGPLNPAHQAMEPRRAAAGSIALAHRAMRNRRSSRLHKTVSLADEIWSLCKRSALVAALVPTFLGGPAYCQERKNYDEQRIQALIDAAMRGEPLPGRLPDTHQSSNNQRYPGLLVLPPDISSPSSDPVVLYPAVPAKPIDTHAQEDAIRVRKLTAGYNAFAFNLFQAVRQSSRGHNIFISPLGAAMLLSIAERGSKGTTQQEIAQALHIEQIKGAELDDQGKKLLDLLSSKDQTMQLEIANGVWVNEPASINTDFISLLKKFYNASIDKANFADGKAVNQINDWVNSRTHGKIPAMLQRLNPSDRLAAINAIYFKALWASKFPRKSTADKSFKLASGSAISHPRMKQSGAFAYYEDASLQLIALPYVGSGTMFVFLPREPLDAFLDGKTQADWAGWVGKLENRAGCIELPRFKLERSATSRSRRRFWASGPPLG